MDDIKKCLDSYFINGNKVNYRCTGVALGTYELHLADLKSIEDQFKSGVDYVDTSICYANDYVLNKHVGGEGQPKVISKIPPQMTDQYEFMVSNHMTQMGVEEIEIMLIHNARSDWSDLAKMLESDKRFKHTGVSNFNVSQLEEYNNLLGHYPEYNEMEINPKYYDKDLIEFCHNKGIKIISYAILGGKYHARSMISKYSLDFCLAFACQDADIVIIRSDESSRIYRMLNTIKTSFSETTRMMNILNEVIIPSEMISKMKSTRKVHDKAIIPDKYDLPGSYMAMVLKSSEFNQTKELPVGNSLLPNLLIPVYTKSSMDSIVFKYGRGRVILVDDFRSDYFEPNNDEFFKFIGGVEGSYYYPEYEFLTDYQVYYRYLLISKIWDLYRGSLSTHVKFYVKGDIQYVELYDNAYDTKKLYMLSVALMTSEFKLSKVRVVNGEKCSVVINFIEVNHREFMRHESIE
jgi:diketogulonate reductase-like aldo/keto reductase